MKKGVAAITIFLQILPLFVKATVLQSIDPKDVATIDGRRYYFSSILVSIPESITVCQELGMTLAGLETEGEYNAVTDYIRTELASTDYYCTSGTRHHSMWIWGNSGEPFSYFKWDVGQPDGRTDEYNVCVKNGYMHDWYPTLNGRFICEEKTLCYNL